jgi:hypothetical protein
VGRCIRSGSAVRSRARLRTRDCQPSGCTICATPGPRWRCQPVSIQRSFRSAWTRERVDHFGCILPRQRGPASWRRVPRRKHHSWHRLRKHSRAMVSNQVSKRSGPGAASLTNKGKHCAGEGSRTPMSFRTDGFEPSAYTIPPPRPRANDQPARRTPASPIILPQPPNDKSIKCPVAVTSIWLECPRDCRSQPD